MKEQMLVTLEGIDLIVEFKIHGKYMPASRLDPEEFEEVKILSIKVEDSKVDIYELLSDKQIENIYSQIEG